MQEIVITGSRIARSVTTEAAPIQVISAEDIASRGVINVQDVLLQNPTFGSPTFSRSNSNFDIANSGIATIDLRNLGEDRTLVLVNGRRFVAGEPGSTAVDLNSIPTALIDHIEVLTDGASAIYGSDAIAGVVNIMMKKDFEGVAVDARYGISNHSDSITKDGTLTMGGKIGSRGHAVAYFGYSEEGAVYSRNRAGTAVDQESTGVLDGELDHAFEVTRPYLSSYAPQGKFTAGKSTYTYLPNGTLVTGFYTNGNSALGRQPDGFNRSAYRTIAIPTTRYTGAANADYELTDWVKAFTEINYAQTHTQSRLEPFPLASNQIFTDPSALGQWDVQYRDANGVIRNNPLVPAAILASAKDSNGDGLKDIQFTKRLSDIDNRGSKNDRQTFRAVLGLEGTIPKIETLVPTFSNFKWDASYNYGQTTQSQVSTGQVNILNFANALDVEQLANGTIQCRNASARAAGCAPLNLFGFNSMSKAAADYVRADQTLNAKVTQKVAQGNISGDVFQLPAGPLGIAIGVEHRVETSASDNDVLTQQGLNGGNKAPNVEGSYHVTEEYAEANIPLLKDLPLIHSLSIDMSDRMASYSSVGDINSWRAGGEYVPVSDLHFRGHYSVSVRAPHVNELYDPGTQTFPTGLVDPCSGITASGGGTLGANCRSIPSILARINSQGSFTPTQAELQGVSGFNSGNPNLGAERSKNISAGAAYSPSFIPNLSLTADYFGIVVDNAVESVPRQFALDQCYRTGDGHSGQFCGLITRDQNGALQYINSNLQNVGQLVTSGIDITAAYNYDLDKLGLAGTAGVHASYTMLFQGYTVPLPGADHDQFAGEIGASRHRATVDLTYSWENLNFDWTVRYIGPARFDDQFLKSYDWPLTTGIGAKIYNDVQVSYALFDRTVELYAGAHNLLDVAPPPVYSGLPGDVTGTETAAGTYDVIGRFVYGGVRVKF
ncbi:TonB-dependent receptor [Nitrospirillum sp. BR 11164]|uniref:TonB-dependent receptor plug domain-containing protein n=1 Tax=Nitrospirillum sp. BR 11164 TaxID=3104324 RepID=UPI002AFDEF11|nr:TonB-dependent receptor [Nitrospirillum sp. BR 11164]MEA1649546.1 TonB-dependent receptor [Nitrospirillum sp. BR 11164]